MNQKQFLKNAIAFFQSGESLDHEMIQYAMGAYITTLDVDDWSTNNYKKRVTDLRKKLTLLFNDLNKDLDIASKESEEGIAVLRDHIKRSNDLPPFALVTDGDDILAFAKGLDKDFYNFSEAEKMIGVTRQTLKKKTDAKVDGVKTVYKNKAPLLTKESVVKLYRHFNPSIVNVNEGLIKKIRSKKVIDSLK